VDNDPTPENTIEEFFFFSLVGRSRMKKKDEENYYMTL